MIEFNHKLAMIRNSLLGDVTVTDPNDYIVVAKHMRKCWDEIKSKLIDNLGGYIRVRRVNNINFIDYLHDSFTTYLTSIASSQ